MGVKAKQALLNILNSNLKDDVKKISASWHNEKVGYPQVTVTQLGSRAASFSDDKTDFRLLYFQIDIWDNGNPFLVAEKIIITLSGQGYEAYDEAEQNEAGVNRVILYYYMEE